MIPLLMLQVKLSGVVGALKLSLKWYHVGGGGVKTRNAGVSRGVWVSCPVFTFSQEIRIIVQDVVCEHLTAS